MKNIKKLARLLMLLLMVLLASILPVPIPQYFKDRSPKLLIEQVEKKEEETEEEEMLKIS